MAIGCHIIISFIVIQEGPVPHPLTLSDSTFALLQSLAKPFVDTPESVIVRLAEEELARRAAPPTTRVQQPTSDGAIRLDPERHESLTHAKLLSASFDGKELHRPKWNGLLDHAHVVARQRLGSFEALQRISRAHLRPGRYEEDGFHYLAEGDFSIQGVDSNFAWAHSLGLARHLRIPIRVKFEWRHKEGVARPGQLAILEWTPPNLAVA
jgi:hypothetical protein